MNNFKKISAIILVICTAAALFSSCKSEDDIPTSSNSAVSVEEHLTETDNSKNETVAVNVTNEKGGVSVSFSEKAVNIPAETTKSVTTAVISPVTKVTSMVKDNTTKASTTKKAVVNDTISENAVGLAMLSKSDPVQVGNHATIFVQGTPNKTYSIEFYETPSGKAGYSALEDKKSDANGFVSWSFEIRNTCDLGKRKVVVREKNSGNYLETSITVI